MLSTGIQSAESFGMCVAFLDLYQAVHAPTPDHRGMPEPDKQTGGEEAKPSRLDEARRIIEEYVAELRETNQKLGRKMN
ncbi:hypothetical protein SE91_16005 [Bradyrhizobium sp. DOA1]|nr:hypothetical protein SE91_16005 [Bradyrhizobium sp. DOA1]